MTDTRHPLNISPLPPPRSQVSSPAPTQPDAYDPVPRGRSKSLAFDTLHHLKRSVDFWGPDPNYTTGIPYKAKTWEPTLEKAIKAIISIKASHVRSFDTETSGNEVKMERKVLC